MHLSKLCFLFGPLLYNKLSWAERHWHFDNILFTLISHVEEIKVFIVHIYSSGTNTAEPLAWPVQTHSAQNHRPSSNKTRTYMWLLNKWPTSTAHSFLTSCPQLSPLHIYSFNTVLREQLSAGPLPSPQSMMILIGDIHSFSTVFLHL